ncbi:(2Fe-2S) ferredoxin domain-containing protein [Pseudonocardia sp. GCM10023141]|uniref:(2Fe-2S) ferredoxin domain-containing protein n=1 Tax=Pseudonocardia sp. GCM10023141 TaxID=3252653 RepID=UPI0036229435
MSGRWIVLVARPTPSGVERRSVDAVVDAVRAAIAEPVHVAFLDQADPSIPAVLDAAVAAGVESAVVVPLAVPADSYLTTWLSRAVANWRETRHPVTLDVRLARGIAASAGLAGAVAAAVAAGGEPITSSPAAFRSPAWSQLPANDRHLLVCRGPRCTSYGSGATHRALSKAARGTDALVTPVGCLGPCNLGPLVIEYPAGTWHRHVDEALAEQL